VIAKGASGRGDHLTLYRRPHLLVAHGEGSVREGLAGILERAGYDVDEAGNSDVALVILNQGNVDTLVVNSRLPPNRCGALLERCHGPLPTVVLGESPDDVEGLGADRRVKSVLMRPFKLQALYDAVARATN